ncbi:hypothetical protein GCM10010412_078260 [Nonomuraea recticatena]|uniref:Uncharacterized protein n=1 Tax=Nonomuraea recticatena TaxID=46178 RepID=A0ABP6FC55_9ACTN
MPSPDPPLPGEDLAGGATGEGLLAGFPTPTAGVLGATHVSVETHGMGLTVREHVAMLEEGAKTYQRQSW